MEAKEQGKEALIAGIEADAQSEAETILKEARVLAEEKRKVGLKRIDALLQEAEDKGRQQAEVITKKATSEVDMEIKRRSLRLQRDLLQEIMNRVEAQLATLIKTPAYRDTLLDWMTEAALGLGAEAVQVNTTEAERPLINESLLKTAAQRVRAQGGPDVTFTMSSGRPLTGQGIMLTAADGRTAFNNQVKTRMLRCQRQMQRLIVDALFTGQDKE